MAPRKRKQNGHRWRELTRRVRAEETHCALCGEYVDQALPHLEPLAASVDHIIPVERGGPEYDRANLTLMHRRCNRWKWTMTLDEARARWGRAVVEESLPVAGSPIW